MVRRELKRRNYLNWHMEAKQGRNVGDCPVTQRNYNSMRENMRCDTESSPALRGKGEWEYGGDGAAGATEVKNLYLNRRENHPIKKLTTIQGKN